MRRSLMLVMVMMLFVAACGDDTPKEGPVTFRTKLNTADPQPHGTFVVDVGADVLGCSSGTAAYIGGMPWDGGVVLTCESGPNAGTFTLDYGSEDVYVWTVVENSGDFAGLQGEGSWDFLITSANAASVTETFTGDIEYAP